MQQLWALVQCIKCQGQDDPNPLWVHECVCVCARAHLHVWHCPILKADMDGLYTSVYLMIQKLESQPQFTDLWNTVPLKPIVPKPSACPHSLCMKSRIKALPGPEALPNVLAWHERVYTAWPSLALHCCVVQWRHEEVDTNSFIVNNSCLQPVVWRHRVTSTLIHEESLNALCVLGFF